MPQILEIPIEGGLDQNADERVSDRLSVAEDVLYHRRGGLTPRLGQRLIPTANLAVWYAASSQDRALAARGNQVAVITGSVVRPLSENVDVPPSNRLSSVGVTGAYVVERVNVDGATNTQQDHTIAEGDGFRCVAWVEADSFRFRILDRETGAVIYPTYNLQAPVVPGLRVLFAQGIFFFVFFDPLSGFQLRIDTFNPTFNFYQANAILALTPLWTFGSWDACVHPNGTHILIVWPSDETTMSVVTVDAVTTPTKLATFTFAIPSVALSIGVSCLTASRFWIAYSTGGAVVGASSLVSNYVTRLNATNPLAITSALGPTLLINETENSPAANFSRYGYMSVILDRGVGQGAFVAFTNTGEDTTAPATSYRPVTWMLTLNDAGSAQQTLGAYGGAIQSAIWTNEIGTGFCIIAQTLPLQANPPLGIVPGLGCMHIVAFLRASPFPYSLEVVCQVHATFGVGVTNTGAAYDCQLRSSLHTRHTGFYSPALVQPDGSVLTTAYALERADTGAHSYIAKSMPVRSRQHAQMGGRTLITGGLPAHWDGRNVVEWGFVHSPRSQGVVLASAANSLAAGSYSWAANYEWIDANGAVMHSAPTVLAAAVAVTANQQATLSISGSQLSHKRDKNGGMGGEGGPTAIILYRTEKDSTGPYYRLTAIDVPAASQNQYGHGRIPIVDAYPDTGGARGPIATFPPIYTTGGILEADPVPTCTMVTTWQQRFCIAGTDDDSVWFSTENEDGEVPYFSLGLRLPSFENGRITGLAVLDDKLVLFKKDAVYTLSGQLPNKQGFGFIPVPTQVSTDAGCIDPQSVVVFPQGVMFRSARGIYLLDRSLQVSFVGEPIARTVEASAKTIAPILVTRQNHIRFDVNESDAGGPGSLAVFDYLRGAWTRFLLNRAGPTGAAPSAQLVAQGGAIYWLDGTGALFRERDAAYTDDGTALFTYRVRSGWQKPAGLQGYFTALRAGVLGKYGGPHTVTINVFADYDEATIVASNVFELSAPPTAGYQLVQSVASGRTSRMQSIALEAVVTANANAVYTGPAAPAIFSSFIIEWDPIDGSPQRRVPVAQKR